jgi:surfactin synthase thioesterase subunit
MLPGDHFFLQSNQALFLRLVSKDLLNLIKDTHRTDERLDSRSAGD